MNSKGFFESLNQQFENELPFVAYRKPNTLSVNAILQKDSELYTTNKFTESGFVFAPFDNKENAVLIPLENSNTIICVQDILSQSEKSHIIGALNKNYDEIPAEVYLERSQKIGMTESKKHHINLVKKGIEAIRDKQFQKVVLSRQEIVSLTNNNPITIFKRLLNTYTSTFVYMWYHPKVGLWLGATPETLLKTQGNRFSTMALAGTKIYKGKLDVEWNDKEKQEQQFVTDYIVSNLQSSVIKISKSKTETIKAGNLLHLQTIIKGTLNFKLSLSGKALLKSEYFKQVLCTLHPTPAVCGLPKNKSKEFILNNENYNREFYTGFLGEINADNSELYVNLRCMQLKDNKAILYVGGGITKDSIPENEWEETLNKAQIIKRVL
jgi:isochorismate synthase